jgi:hypothetical protein
MNKFILLIMFLLVSVLSPLLFIFYKDIMREKYTNLGTIMGKYPISEDNALLQYGNSYPISGKNGVSNKNISDIWWYNPIFKEGSYEQITNNLRYRNNPDNGSCSRSEFCGALYKDNQVASNISTPLPPVKPSCGSRINYYYTPENLLTYRNVPSILY